MSNFSKLCILLIVFGVIIVIGIGIFNNNNPINVDLEKELMLNELEEIVIYFEDYVYDGKKYSTKTSVTLKKDSEGYQEFVRLLANQTTDVKEHNAVQIYGPMTHQIGLYYKDWLRVTIWYSSIRNKIFVYDDSANYITGKIKMPFSTRSYVISADDEFVQMVNSLGQT